MRLLFLDYEDGFQPGEFAKFSSDTSCYDFDAVVWDPANTLYDYNTDWNNSPYRGLSLLDDSSSVRLLADIARRRTEFREFVDGGRVVVVIGGPPQQCYYDTGQRTYSGTGRNRTPTVQVGLTDVWSALPMKLSLSVAAGTNMEFVGPAEFRDFWAAQRHLLSYQALIEGDFGTPVIQVKGTKRVVGSVVRTKAGGAIILLPRPIFSASEEVTPHEAEDEDEVEDDELESEPTGRKKAAFDFQADLRSLIAAVQGGPSEALPTWSAKYVLQGEHDLRTKILRQEELIEAARSELTALQTEFDQLESRKRLFTGTGRALELEVRRVFEALGCRVEEPEPGRDDWLLMFPGDVPAVAEVKGVGKSGAEKHAAQLEKWVSNYFETHGALPKGILVVNAWRELELGDRTDPAFPEQMLEYSKSRGHCLVTGTQLLGLLQELEAQPERAEHWRKKFLETKGVLQGFGDWKRIVAAPPGVESESDDTGSTP